MRLTTKTRIKDCISVALLTTAAVTLALCLTDCRSTLASATESREASTETMRTVTSTKGTEYVHDSVFVYVGDTVVITRWRTSWREHTVYDTVREHTTDTIVKVQTVEKVVKETSGAGKVGWIVALALFSIILIYILIKILLKTH